MNDLHRRSRDGLRRAGALAVLALVTPARAEAPADRLSTDELAAMSLRELLDTEIVESVSRREQSLHDAPAAVSLLTGAQIARMGVTHIAEVFRRVVGVHVVRSSTSGYSVGIRAPASDAGGRMPVILDGRIVSEPIGGTTVFAWLPVHPADVERIEVIRGPATAAHGADAVGGIIAIRSRRPLDGGGTTAEFQGGVSYLPGDDTGEKARADNVGFGHVATSLVNPGGTAGVRLGAHFGLVPEQNRLPLDDVRNGQFAYALKAAGQWRPAPATECYVTATHTASEAVSAITRDPDNLAVRISEQAASLELLTRRAGGRLELRASGDASKLEIDTDIGGSSRQLRLLGQADARTWGDRSVASAAAELSYKWATSINTLSPRTINLGLLLQYEVKLLPQRQLILAAGLRSDILSFSDSARVDVRYVNHSPRLSAIWRFSDNQSMRVTAGQAFRVPTATEVSSGVLLPPAMAGDPPVRLLVPNPQLVPETARTLELGYRADLAGHLRLDVTLFLQRQRDRIDGQDKAALPYMYVNHESVDQLGAELAGFWAISRRINTYAHYRGLRSRGVTTGDDYQEMPPHIAGIGLDADLLAGTTLHLDGYLVQGFRRSGLGPVGDSPVVRRQLIAAPDQIDLNLRVGKWLRPDRTELFASLRHAAALVRDREQLAQAQPAPNSYPVGALFLVGIRVRE